VTSQLPNIEPALKALADALHGEGPAVELSADADGNLVVSAVETPGFEDAAVVVRTSGSTGTPKATVLTVEALAASSVATAFAHKGEGQWLLALPVQYVAGLQVLVRSLFAGTRPWAMDLSGGFTPEAFTAAAQELTDKIRFTSLVPTQLQRLLDAPSAETLAALRRFNGILLGGGPASPELLAAARDAGARVITTYGSALLARQIGQKAAREIFFLAREYSAEDMVRMGAVNEAVDHERLEEVALEYAADIARQSPQAIRMLKFAFNLADDGLAGQQVFAGEATRLAYMTDEAVEGKEAFLEKRDPDWSKFPYYF
jgi:acyl-CoA synthetase (AMP-forming)/AMP-acid ligase II